MVKNKQVEETLQQLTMKSLHTSAGMATSEVPFITDAFVSCDSIFTHDARGLTVAAIICAVIDLCEVIFSESNIEVSEGYQNNNLEIGSVQSSLLMIQETKISRSKICPVKARRRMSIIACIYALHVYADTVIFM